jgi:hemoglobin
MTRDDQFFEADPITVYGQVCRRVFFVELVERFFKLVEADPVLRPIYPQDLEPGKAHLACFWAQYWDGPAQYMLERGHPRPRPRHIPFPVGQTERDA